MPTLDIIVKKRSDDYIASFADSANAGLWESGKSEAEAIGKLVISARSSFGVAILRKK